MANTNEKLSAYYREVATTFPPKVQEALKMIADPPLELLALRRYVRKDDDKELDAQWVWSAEQIRKFEHSAEFKRTNVQIEKVKTAFEDLNDGYTLRSSPIRDLKDQVSLWKGNDTVHTAAKGLKQYCLRAIVDYPDQPDLPATKRFRSFLKGCEVDPEPTSAAPGLSDHGQMHAVDFVVVCKRDGKIVAGTKSRDMKIRWDAAGWTEKLKDAVTQSGSLFIGPLAKPREPWHYTLQNAKQKLHAGQKPHARHKRHAT
jgi:hypothetical protein